MSFPTDFTSVFERIEQINPSEYARTRNFKDGAVTRLSPYISRGVISTKDVFDHILSLKRPWNSIEKLVQELAWRDYWQQVWIHVGEEINTDLRHPQEPIANHEISDSIVQATTGIQAIDEAIEEFYESGYMHNHMRMYVASLACNIAQSHWLNPAHWMYAHLLDGDWASNALSWQWVAGSNANKKYYANQENINKYFSSNQRGSYLDLSYEQIPTQPIPCELDQTSKFQLHTALPDNTPELNLDPNVETLVYNYYNLDPRWHAGENYNRVLLLEPSFFEQYPVTQHVLDFCLKLSENISDIQIFTGSFEALASQSNQALIYKEHPTNKHYIGVEEPRDWMFDVTGNYRSFFAFWKKCMKSFKKQKALSEDA